MYCIKREILCDTDLCYICPKYFFIGPKYLLLSNLELAKKVNIPAASVIKRNWDTNPITLRANNNENKLHFLCDLPARRGINGREMEDKIIAE